MSIRVDHAISVSALITGLSLLTASCSSMLMNGRSAEALPSRPAQQPLQQRIVQLHFGRDAVFALCIEPACPAVTPKTTASAALPVNNTQVAVKAEVIAPSTSTSLPPTPARVVVRFPSGVTTLDADAKHELDRMMPLARTAEKITIMGRTDNVGSPKFNHSVALTRALQVRDYLRRQIKDVNNTIEIDARGSCCFITNNDTSSGRQENRRVEVVFTLRG